MGSGRGGYRLGKALAVGPEEETVTAPGGRSSLTQPQEEAAPCAGPSVNPPPPVHSVGQVGCLSPPAKPLCQVLLQRQILTSLGDIGMPGTGWYVL